VSGAKITPFLLKRVNEITGGESSASNIELIKNNARLAGKIAVELSKL
jgi:pseudouridine-5'-phosphate glycosidase